MLAEVRSLPLSGSCSVAMRAHQRRLAGAVGAEQAEHAGGDVQRDRRCSACTPLA